MTLTARTVPLGGTQPMPLSSLIRSCFAVFALSLGACTLTADDFTPASAAPPENDSCSNAGCPPQDPAAGSAPNPVTAPSQPGSGTGESSGLGGAPAISPLPPLVSVPVSPGTADAGAPPPEDPPTLANDPAVLLGWASLPGLGVASTTGGGASAVILATTREELIELAERPEPLTIAIAGSLDVGRVDLSSDKTLLGLGNDATLRGGIVIRGTVDRFVQNVIVRNLHIDASTSEADGDGIQVHYAHHVWIDHCAIRDAADGLIDIVHGSDFVTLSFNRFFYTDVADEAHSFATLIGHSTENGAEDASHLNVTLHHNWWADGVSEALFGRFGAIHLFDNYFASPGNENVLTAALLARFLVENNVFERVAAPHAVFPASSASLAAAGNAYVETSGARDVSGSGFVPAYVYALDDAADVPELVTLEAGPR